MIDVFAKIVAAAALAVTAQVLPGINLLPSVMDRVAAYSPEDETLYDCLQSARQETEDDRRAAEETFKKEIVTARQKYQTAVRRAWDDREVTIKEGRVTITAPDKNGRVKPDIKAERGVFETVKKDAEETYEAAKKSASQEWQETQRQARERLKTMRQEAMQNLKDAKGACATTDGNP